MGRSSHNRGGPGRHGRKNRLGAKCAPMKSVCRFLLLVPLALGACQRGDTSSQDQAAKTPVAPPTGDYAADISALCDCVARSGAADDDSRTLTIANWLSANLKTAE